MKHSSSNCTTTTATSMEAAVTSSTCSLTSSSAPTPSHSDQSSLGNSSLTTMSTTTTTTIDDITVGTSLDGTNGAAAEIVTIDRQGEYSATCKWTVFGALSQLECSDVWERVLIQSFDLLADSNDKPLAATIDFTFKTASQCQLLPEAVRSVRTWLGADVSPFVLDFLSRTVNSWGDVVESILRDIDCDDALGDSCSTLPCSLFLCGENASAAERLHVVDEQTFHFRCHFSDIYILIEMLSIPCLAVEASHTFERVVSRGAIMAQSVTMVLERRLAQRLSFNAKFVTENSQHSDAVIEEEASEQLRVQHDDFSIVLGLAETLALSRDLCVKGFVKMLYTILFKRYANETYRGRMLKRLVDCATSTTDNSRDVDLYLDILAILVCEEQEIVKPVLSMMREVAELANIDRAAL
ncbi:hypothetical protein OIU77_031430 [Salix suchowensis]|uniref:Uncharacterized protein n=1 Tax=Salix suchowensis TaxID=1278906 RepID=A0ABQ9BFR4_9ROSI|nr:hypothetical protein OIU77_031430 [Salix suchowensis]